MYDRGEDPQEALIARGHELGLDVYASVRMNDNHFGGAQVADLNALYKAHHVEALRYEHPEWVLGERTSEWFCPVLEYGRARNKTASLQPRRRDLPAL